MRGASSPDRPDGRQSLSSGTRKPDRQQAKERMDLPSANPRVEGAISSVFLIGRARSKERRVAYQDLSDARTDVARREPVSSSTTVLVSRRESFNAAHQLCDPHLSDEENQRVFGKCANVHGHNYVLEVVVAGAINRSTGYVLDLKLLSDVIDRLILQEVDHRNLNTDVPWLQGLIPTAENLAVAFWERVRSELPDGSLRSLRLWETDKNWAEVGDHV